MHKSTIALVAISALVGACTDLSSNAQDTEQPSSSAVGTSTLSSTGSSMTSSSSSSSSSSSTNSLSSSSSVLFTGDFDQQNTLREFATFELKKHPEYLANPKVVADLAYLYFPHEMLSESTKEIQDQAKLQSLKDQGLAAANQRIASMKDTLWIDKIDSLSLGKYVNASGSTAGYFPTDESYDFGGITPSVFSILGKYTYSTYATNLADSVATRLQIFMDPSYYKDYKIIFNQTLGTTRLYMDANAANSLTQEFTVMGNSSRKLYSHYRYGIYNTSAPNAATATANDTLYAVTTKMSLYKSFNRSTGELSGPVGEVSTSK